MRKRLFIVLALMVCGIAGAWAGEVDVKKAQDIALDFVSKHNNRKSAPTVEEPFQVSGLYVFNLSKNAGYVIVSNDDQTTPILGFSDSGNIDPKNMPDNMRAWLQGYADEIAWIQKNGITTTPAADKARRRAITNHNTIGPLLTTTWNQNYPYNAFCPQLSNGNYCATGCVATAMAQAMYYTEIKAGNSSTTTTKQIPGYTTKTYNFSLPAIAAGTTINWSQMKLDYSSSYTSEEATAVAYLMRYCGRSVEMDYGPESSSNTVRVADALKTYFGYDTGTTKYVARSCYTYDNWKELIYHELSELRPVVYGGQSSGGGHEFVCDGYQYDYENNKDLFHINWGWGGQSDGLFVLSALNPEEQGIGGSSSTDGFHYGQDAVIGIQKIGGTGTTLNVPINDYKLTINSISLSHNTIALGESVDVTLNVSNSGTEAYDGDLWLVRGNTAFLGNMFTIPAGTTNQDCVISYTPTDEGSITLESAFINNNGKFDGPGYTVTLNVVNQTPTGLAASNITQTTADIDWTNVGNATKWNMRSRPATTTIEGFEEFSDTYDTNGNTDNGWKRLKWSTDGNWRISTNGGIGGSKCFISPSYENTDQDPDVGLMSPRFSFGGTFTFYAWGSGEKFQIYMSTDGSHFSSITNVTNAADEPTQYTLNLAKYAGQEGHILIDHCYSSGHTSDSYLHIDNVSYIEVGEWTTATDISTNHYTLTGLNTETDYEVQMQAVKNNGGKWSNPFTFTTAPLVIELGNNNTDNVNKIETWDKHTTTVTLTGRTLYKDGGWNTICLPFSLNATQLANSPLAGAVIRELSKTTISGGKVTGFDNATSSLVLNFETANNAIEAGKPYIVKWTTIGDDITNPEFTNVTIDKQDASVTSNDGAVTFTGSYNKQVFNEVNTSILLLGTMTQNEQIKSILYYPKNGASLGACRAYFQLAKDYTAGEPESIQQGTSGLRNFVLNFGDDYSATGIIAIGDSQLSTLNSPLSGWYTLDGRKLNGKPTAKGVYVKNGKKIVIK